MEQINADVKDTKSDECVVAMQFERIKMFISKDTFIHDIPTLDGIESFKKMCLENIESFKTNKDKFTSVSNFDDYVEILESKCEKKIQKLMRVQEEYLTKQQHILIEEIKQKIMSDDVLHKIYETQDDTGLQKYYAQVYCDVKNKLHLSEIEIPLKCQELVRVLSDLQNNMETYKELHETFYKQFQVYVGKFKKYIESQIEEITDEINDAQILDDHAKIWQRYNDDINGRYVKYCNKVPTQYCEHEIENNNLIELRVKCVPNIPDYIILKYKSLIEEVMKTNWISVRDKIKSDIYNAIYIKNTSQSSFPEECLELRDFKKPKVEHLYECNNFSLITADVLYMKKLVLLCKKDVYYIGNIYTNPTDDSSDSDTVIENKQITKLIKNMNIERGIYSKDKLNKLTLSEKQINEIFEKIEVTDDETLPNNAIYIFNPKNVVLFTEYSKIMKKIDDLAHIEKTYGINISSLLV